MMGAIAVLAVLLLALLAFDNRLKLRCYEIDAPELAAPVRIALVTDLHSCRYGEGQAELIEAVYAQQPDAVLLGGDIFDDVQDNANTEIFLAGIAADFPCYYVTGNHEYWGGEERFGAEMAVLEALGIHVLSGGSEIIRAGGQEILLCGVDDPDAHRIPELKDGPGFHEQLEGLGREVQAQGYSILLSHRPEYFESYAQYDFDLVLSGHAHGGQWRIPGLLNGLFAPDQGIFPVYAGGRYEGSGTTMIVSRGLARESTRVPRIFNRPELVIVELY